MLTIRLKRIGKKKFPTYRFIISEKTKDTWGTSLEELGSYNPHAKGKQLSAKADRIKFWISKGAQLSDTVNNLLISAGIIEGKKKKSIYLSKKRKAKLEEKTKQKVEAEAKKQAEQAPPAQVAVVPAEPVEVPAEPEIKTETSSAEEPAVEKVTESAPTAPVTEEQKPEAVSEEAV